MIKNMKEKAIGLTGSASGAASVLGSWQICHNICLGIVALLAVIGITLVGMPLMFLTKIAVPMWIAAFILLMVASYFYVRKKCISKNMMLLNSGLIIAGVPFQQLQDFNYIFWIVGGALAAASAYMFIKGKIERRSGKK